MTRKGRAELKIVSRSCFGDWDLNLQSFFVCFVCFVVPSSGISGSAEDSRCCKSLFGGARSGRCTQTSAIWEPADLRSGFGGSLQDPKILVILRHSVRHPKNNFQISRTDLFEIFGGQNRLAESLSRHCSTRSSRIFPELGLSIWFTPEIACLSTCGGEFRAEFSKKGKGLRSFFPGC